LNGNNIRFNDKLIGSYKENEVKRLEINTIKITCFGRIKSLNLKCFAKSKDFISSVNFFEA